MAFTHSEGLCIDLFPIVILPKIRIGSGLDFITDDYEKPLSVTR
jgi:hypothetical protein